MKYEMMGKICTRKYNKSFYFAEDSICPGYFYGNFEELSIGELVNRMIKCGMTNDDVQKISLKTITNEICDKSEIFKKFKSERDLRIGDSILITEPKDIECSIDHIQYDVLNDTVILYTDYVIKLNVNEVLEAKINNKLNEIKKVYHNALHSKNIEQKDNIKKSTCILKKILGGNF